MKEGWEIKKLGEVCEIQGGSTPKRTESLYWENGTYPWFTIEDIREQGRIITDTKQKVTEIAWNKLRVFPKDTILLCCTASLGEYAITKIPLTTNQQFNGLMIKDKNYLSPMYLMHFCVTLKNIHYALIGKATIDFVSAEKVRQISIPIPPIAEQEKIVAELDCLSGIIEKKKQQLKEYDALAQSIFYEMFGDPITNEKSWEMRKLGEVGELARGVSKHRPRNAPELLGGNIPLIQTGDIANAGMYIQKYNSTYSDLGLSQSRLWPAGTLCITIAATIGKCSILTFDSCFPDSVVGYIVNSNYTNNEYIFYIFGSLQKILEENAPAVAQKNINLKILNDLLIPIPPFALQQQFASKIEAIEKQKELIKKSIEEVETLFNSRMDYYFN